MNRHYTKQTINTVLGGGAIFIRNGLMPDSDFEGDVFAEIRRRKKPRIIEWFLSSICLLKSIQLYRKNAMEQLDSPIFQMIKAKTYYCDSFLVSLPKLKKVKQMDQADIVILLAGLHHETKESQEKIIKNLASVKLFCLREHYGKSNEIFHCIHDIYNAVYTNTSAEENYNEIRNFKNEWVIPKFQLYETKYAKLDPTGNGLSYFISSSVEFKQRPDPSLTLAEWMVVRTLNSKTRQALECNKKLIKNAVRVCRMQNGIDAMNEFMGLSTYVLSDMLKSLGPCAAVELGNFVQHTPWYEFRFNTLRYRFLAWIVRNTCRLVYTEDRFIWITVEARDKEDADDSLSLEHQQYKPIPTKDESMVIITDRYGPLEDIIKLFTIRNIGGHEHVYIEDKQYGYCLVYCANLKPNDYVFQ